VVAVELNVRQVTQSRVVEMEVQVVAVLIILQDP
jgi:hypothetical protein